MKIAEVSSSDLLSKPWGSLYHFPSEPSEGVKRLAGAVKLFRSLAHTGDRAGDLADWDALGEVVENAIQRHVVKNSTSSDRGKLNQNQADVRYLIEHGLHEKEDEK